MNHHKFLYPEDGYAYPFLMPSRKNDPLFVIDGIELNSDNIWHWKDITGTSREVLVDKIIAYVQTHPWLPKENVTLKEIISEINKLKKKTAADVLTAKGELKNTSNIGIKICRDVNPKFYDVKGGNKSNDKLTPSILDIFKNPDHLKDVLWNRMGSFTTTETHIEIVNGKETKVSSEQPYIFPISYSQIIQGMRSCRKTLTVSNFRPLIAKYLYEHVDAKKILDLSAGWGARFLASAALDLEYYGIDPMTADNLNNKLVKVLDYKKAVVVKGCSENKNSYKNFPVCDTAIACPPYFIMEEYDPTDKMQSTTDREYSVWLEKYWKPTVENMTEKTSKNFCFIMIDKFLSYNLADDMNSIIESFGWKLKEIIPYKTGKSHLSGKRNKTGDDLSKGTEKVYIFSK